MGRPRKSLGEPLPTSKPRRAPARSLEARENQIIALAYDVAEAQMRNGTASSQIIAEFVKRGSTEARLRKEMMVEQKELLKAKTDALKAAERVEELYEKAIDAMKRYNGSTVEGDYEN